MQFELTNEQRKYVGLEPVQDTWDLVQLNEENFLYFDGDIIRKQITVNDLSYYECMLNEQTKDNRQTLLPKTTRGKAKKLNISSIQARYGIGVYFSFGNSICIGNYTTQTAYFYEPISEEKYKGIEGLKQWLEEWITDTTEKDIVDLEQFRVAKRKHVKYQVGDFFTFKISRREYGFGRILLDINRLRKNGILEKEKHYGLNFMGKPLIVKVYHKISDSPTADIDELLQCDAFPSQPIMDNVFYYGEYKIIGNIELEPKELDFPISFGRSISCINLDAVYLQYGLIYRETDINRYNKYLIAEDKCGRRVDNPYRNGGISFGLNALLDIDVMKQCIHEKSNAHYWNRDEASVIYDLRNPSLLNIKREIFKYFGLDAEASYSEILDLLITKEC